MKSNLYLCEIAHSRTSPKPHRFRHKHFMFHLALDEIPALENEMKLFGQKWFQPYRFEQSDYLPDESKSQTLFQRVCEHARSFGLEDEIKEITLLTNVRFFGYVFNPLSLFYCFDANGQALCCVAEVGNTFGEKKAYFIPVSDVSSFCAVAKKEFYVSPFAALDDYFSFRLGTPTENLKLSIDTLRTDQLVVASSVTGIALPLSDKSLFKLTCSLPFATLRVIGLIHAQALMLWLKRIPFHRKEENPHLQTQVRRPRSWTKQCKT